MRAGHQSLAGFHNNNIGNVTVVINGNNYSLDIPLAFGQGAPGTDDVIPDDDDAAESFWLMPSTDADHATPDQVREWPVTDNHDRVGLVVRVDAANMIGDTAQLIVTKNGVDTAVAVTIPMGATANVTLSDERGLTLVPGDRVGVRFAPGDDLEGACTLRCEARLRARFEEV